MAASPTKGFHLNIMMIEAITEKKPRELKSMVLKKELPGFIAKIILAKVREKEKMEM